MEQEFRITRSAEMTAGVFADFIRAWHTNDAFVLDFVALAEPPQRVDDEHLVLESAVVSRVRIPPAQVFELMKALEQQLSAWESERKKPA